MLFRFTSPDMLNTSLIDVVSNQCAYDILTISLRGQGPSGRQRDKPVNSPIGFAPAASSSKPQNHLKPSSDSDGRDAERRQTIVTDASGKAVANIIWNDRRPDITILDENVGALTDLFGSSTVRFMPKVLTIPTRFDTEYVWMATPESLTLFDYDTETIKGTFHRNVFYVPIRSKASRTVLSSSLKHLPSRAPPSILDSTSSISLCSETSKGARGQDSDTPVHKSCFISAHIPGLGSSYLEFLSHPLAHDVEIILSFLMMEILRRGRFNLPSYTFEKRRPWQEAQNLVMRRLRRNTV